jgi:ubiquinone/menaquinone biosynthesis C-methylase UbiE
VSKASDFQFTNETVPPAYDRYYRPRIFDPWGRFLVDRAALKPGMRVLDVATGPGTVARIAAERVGPSGAVTGTDISPVMLEVARSKPSQAGAAKIEYLVSPAAPLAVGDAAFDVVLCQQGLQFFGDRAAALAEMRRALRPSGRVAAAVWCDIERCPSFYAAWQALRETGQPDLAELYRAPFTMPAQKLDQEMRAAGFSAVEVHEFEKPLIFEEGTPQAIAALAASPVFPMIAALPTPSKEAFLAAAERNLNKLLVDGQIRTVMMSSIATADRP